MTIPFRPDLGDVEYETAPFGLVVPSGVVSITGVAGLTIGGGFGYLCRKCGMTIDNLRSVDLVTGGTGLEIDNEFVTVPNSDIASAAVVNNAADDKRRVSIVFGIGYEDDLELAREAIIDKGFV